MAEALGRINFSIPDLLAFDERSLHRDRIAEIFEVLYRTTTDAQFGAQLAYQPGRIDLNTISCARANGLAGFELVGRWQMPTSSVQPGKPGAKQPKATAQPQQPAAGPLSDAEVEQIFSVLPKQPWKKGMQQAVATQAGLALPLVRRAINYLIAQGRVSSQYDGVVVNAEGIITAIDPKTADPRHVIGEKFVRSISRVTNL